MAPGKTGGWSDDHEDDTPAAPDAGEMIWERPRAAPRTFFVPRLGIGVAPDEQVPGYALPLLRRFIDEGAVPLVIALAANGWALADRLRRALQETLDPARIVAVITDPEGASAALIEAVATELTARFPDARVLLLVGGRDAASVLIAPTLVHYAVGVLELSASSQAPPAAFLATDCLLLHAPRETTPAMAAAVAGIVARRGHLPTPLVLVENAADLDAIFALIWADLIDEPFKNRAPSSA